MAKCENHILKNRKCISHITIRHFELWIISKVVFWQENCLSRRTFCKFQHNPSQLNQHNPVINKVYLIPVKRQKKPLFLYKFVKYYKNIYI